MSIIKTIQFRFKSPAVTVNTPPSQSLFVNIDNDDTPQFTVVLEHTSSLASGSYSGSIPDPYSKYGTLKLTHEDIGTSASVYLPFLDGGWWSVMVAQSDSYTYTLYAANKLYDGVDGNTVGFKGTDSFTGSLDWNNHGTVYFPGSGSTTTLSKTYIPFDGELQELRYFTETITEQQFDAYTQNPNSIEGSSDLTFRASLGGELFTQSSSIHPGVGGAVQSNSFSTGNNFTLISGSFGPNYETILVDQVLGGVRNRVSDKIKRPNLVLPLTSSTFNNIPNNKVLSSQLQIQQNLEISQSSTRDVNYTEVALSPQNEINDDINATYGYFNIGEYIGDPRQITSSLRDYPDLVSFKNGYFNKYSHSYDYKDYIRLSKYYDNAVFQMIKDFSPVRTGLATGTVVKQHLLERNRVRPAQVTLRDETLTGSIKPQSRGYEAGTVEVFSGGPGGSVNSLTDSNQAWTASYSTPAGLVTQIESSQYEFYNGEYSGSTTTAQISHSINPDPILNNVEDNRASTFYQDVDYSSDARTPVNLNLILSGSAFPAIVPDSNYTALRSITPRYLGSKNSGEINYSQSFADSSIQEGYPVDRLTPWFAHFNGIYNSSDLGLGIGGNLNVTQLINAETLDTITLTSENKNLDFMGQLFKQGDKPSIIPATTDLILEGAVELEAIGELYQTILLKSGSAGTGFQGNFYPNGAINSDYATSNPDTRGFYNGIAVTQSLDHYTFPSQASFRGYAPTVAATELYPIIGSIQTVTTTANHPINGLPAIYTTLGTAESRSLAAGEVKRALIVQSASASFLERAYADFDKWYITSGSITQEDNNLTSLPNEWSDGLPFIRFYFSASSTATSNLNWTLNYLEFSSSFESGWLDGLTSNPENYPNNFASAMQSFGNVYIYNKLTNEYTQEVVNPAEETYFPIQRGDFIRVGTTASLDTYVKAGSEQISPLAAMRVISYTPNSEATYISTVAGNESTNTFRRLSNDFFRTGYNYNAGLLSPLPEVEGLTDPADYTKQNFRILRRIPTEFYILVKNKPGAYDGEGLLLPENFDPKYDARKAAIEVGAISRIN